ncbi:hypothetical protein FH972_026465 [Carpinus fangiana]|uniref:Flavanone 4-reductase n=1 Tax=Carpinus fangiana TaxID=176857 RepID=A0A5N6L462_9ROSI|nr:hypothetical protein FH972_026465 [Carpinus fangiana]
MASDLVLLTGATGHIGFRALVDALKAGYRVRAAIRSTTAVKVQKIKASPEIAALKLAPGALTFTTVPDFLAPGAFDEAVKGVKYIVHIASPIASGTVTTDDYDAFFIQPAVRGTLSLLESAQKAGGIAKIVVTSSIVAVMPYAAIGGVEPRTRYDADSRVEFVPGPYDNNFHAYIFSKVAALNEAEAWFRKHQPAFSLVHVHPGLVLGRDALVNDLEELKSNGTNPWLLAAATGDAEPKIGGTVHVDDIAQLHILALQPQITGLKSIGGSINSDWSEMAGILDREFPDAVKKGDFKADPGLASTVMDFDSLATEKTFGFKFQSFAEQVKSVLGHYIELSGSA